VEEWRGQAEVQGHTSSFECSWWLAGYMRFGVASIPSFNRSVNTYQNGPLDVIRKTVMADLAT
jgi:hypothetical protein